MAKAMFIVLIIWFSFSSSGRNCAVVVKADCENIAQTLWEKSKAKAEKVFDVDFVRALRNGTLCEGDGIDPYHRYKYYSAQDAFYAKGASVALYFAEYQAADSATKLLLQKRRERDESYMASILSEIATWKSQGWTEPSPGEAAVDFVGFEVDVARNETSTESPVANLMAAKSICVRLYYYIGNTIAREWECNIYEQPYKSWIDNNVTPNLDDSHVSSTERLFNTVAANLTAAECGVLEYYYDTALDHEFKFFEAVPPCPATNTSNKLNQLPADGHLRRYYPFS